MFNHHNAQPTQPQRVVILGANGFVGKTTKNRLLSLNFDVLALTRNEINLLDANAADKLSHLLQPTDALVITAAQAPCKNHTMLCNNIKMMEAICQALEKSPVAQIIYISSDAVYADSDQPLTEKSSTAATSLHGIMHVTREMMLQSVAGNTPLALLRPSLLYGANDPHNGYGPNQFRRLCAEEKAISLFGNGEEQRDHVYIGDVAELIYLTLMHKSAGILNIATGSVTSFHKIASMINALSGNTREIITRPRSGPMPHNGLRPFCIDACKQAFPKFNYTTLAEGLKFSQADLATEVTHG